LRQEHAPVGLESAVPGVGHGGGAHGHEHRVEEGERADRHLVGVFIFLFSLDLLVSLAGATRNRKEAIPQCAQQKDGKYDDPEQHAATKAKERTAALGDKEG
jgi:hypothetical protein